MLIATVMARRRSPPLSRQCVTNSIAMQAVAEGRFYAFTTTSFDGAIRQRADDILSHANPSFEDIVAMSRKDAGLDGGTALEPANAG